MMDTPDPQPAIIPASPPHIIEQKVIKTEDTGLNATTETPDTETPMDAADEPAAVYNEPPPPPTQSQSKGAILTEACVYRLLAQSIGTITLNCGYHEAHQASLDILTDVCCDYIKRISSMLRLAVDTDGWRDPECDFVDPLERVFHQINIPSAANLHQFVCKMEAIKKHDRKSC